MTSQRILLLHSRKSHLASSFCIFGNVETIVHQNDAYIVSFLKNSVVYEVVVDRQSGAFSNLKLVFEQLDQTTQQPTTEKPVEKPPVTPIPVHLTAQQVQQIALKQLTGKVESIDYYDTADGGYYLVEVDGEDEEATLQIHSITGKVLSVTFDD